MLHHQIVTMKCTASVCDTYYVFNVCLCFILDHTDHNHLKDMTSIRLSFGGGGGVIRI